MHKPAKEPNDLEWFFVERANANDVEGLVALYEPSAIIDSGDVNFTEGTARRSNMSCDLTYRLTGRQQVSRANAS